jgi:hypothetical protein
MTMQQQMMAQQGAQPGTAASAPMPQQFMQMPSYMPQAMQTGDPAQYQQSPFGFFPMMPAQVNP